MIHKDIQTETETEAERAIHTYIRADTQRQAYTHIHADMHT